MLTEEEKWELLQALQKHGTNIEALKEQLPHWSTSCLQTIILRYRKRAAKRMKIEATSRQEKGEKHDLEQTALEEWYDVIQCLQQFQGTSDNWRKRGRRFISSLPCDHSPLLAKVMAYVAILEDHPASSHPSHPNYTSIYRYLSQLLAGDEPTELDSRSAAHVSKMMRRVKEAVETAMANDETKAYQEHLHSPLYQTLHFQRKQGVAPISDNFNGSGRSTTKELQCLLFQDPEENLVGCEGRSEGSGVDGIELKPGHPYYEMDCEKFIKKMTEVQQEADAEMNSVPGLNPLHVFPRLIVKPSSILSPTSL
ncbi:hypothetical protein Pmani_011384 [Petrolisthes manimaculis]|uniref:Uncharacterized protein n=1 Tax=Petrolisthes manimaculis TaxID=1843537 RepID=A0AAE1UFR1_9EUCA|nr:hypothetical protein Pmani_011384 [Petrolisthes manimaculis]